MKITDKRIYYDRTDFSDLEIGDMFFYDDDLYIKIDDFNGFNMCANCIVEMYDKHYFELVDIEIILHNYVHRG